MKKGEIVICNTANFNTFTQGKKYVVEDMYTINNVQILVFTNDEGVEFFLPDFYFDTYFNHKERDNSNTFNKNLMKTLFNSLESVTH